MDTITFEAVSPIEQAMARQGGHPISPALYDCLRAVEGLHEDMALLIRGPAVTRSLRSSLRRSVQQWYPHLMVATVRGRPDVLVLPKEEPAR